MKYLFLIFQFCCIISIAYITFRIILYKRYNGINSFPDALIGTIALFSIIFVGQITVGVWYDTGYIDYSEYVWMETFI